MTRKHSPGITSFQVGLMVLPVQRNVRKNKNLKNHNFWSITEGKIIISEKGSWKIAQLVFMPSPSWARFSLNGLRYYSEFFPLSPSSRTQNVPSILRTIPLTSDLIRSVPYPLQNHASIIVWYLLLTDSCKDFSLSLFYYYFFLSIKKKWNWHRHCCVFEPAGHVYVFPHEVHVDV